MASQSGTINFQLSVSDLNGHIESESFNISDGAVSPAVVLDSIFPNAFNGVRYYKEGEKFIIEGHVGYTKMDCDIFNYYITGDGSSNDDVDIVYTTIENLETGEKLYEFKDTEKVEIATTGMSGQQKVTFQFLADGSSETSDESVYFKDDFVAPEFDMAADPVTSDSTYYYIDVKFDEPVWGGEYFSSLLAVSDFAVTNTHGALSINSITNITGSIDDGQTEVRLRVLKSAGNIYSDGSTIYSINSAGTSGSYGIFDVANNTPTVAGTFTFPDETAPSVTSFSPSDDDTEVTVDSNITVTFNETVTLGAGSITLYKTSDDSPVTSTVTASGAAVTINPDSNLEEGTDYYVQIASNAVRDDVGNYYEGISDKTSWNFTTDPAPELAILRPAFTCR